MTERDKSTIKKGLIRYSGFVDFDSGRVQYDEWIISSIQNRHGSLKIYWINKIKDLTWGKRTKKTGDFGFLNNIPNSCRKVSKYPALIYSATKKGALRFCIADLRKDVKRFGENERLFEDDVYTLGERLDRAIRAQKRHKLKQNK